MELRLTYVGVSVEGSYVVPQHSSEECYKRCMLAVSLLSRAHAETETFVEYFQEE